MTTGMAERVIAILATDGAEQSELMSPKLALEQAGARVLLVSLHAGCIQTMHKDDERADRVQVDLDINAARGEDFAGLVLPGGTLNPDRLRMNPTAVSFVRHFVQTGKPIAAICHGPWTLLEAGGAKGRKMTSWPSLKTDLRNAGAEWVDEACVVDGNIITSRRPDDLPDFNRAILRVFLSGNSPSGASLAT